MLTVFEKGSATKHKSCWAPLYFVQSWSSPFASGGSEVDVGSDIVAAGRFLYARLL